MGLPQISVVLPVRDAQATLDAAVESVLSSRGVEFELVCLDDGSRDASPRMLDDWATRDARVRVHHLTPRGIAGALNQGLDRARAALVARMDADDEMHPERLAEQADFLAEHPEVALVGCQVESFREGGLLEGYRLYSSWVNGLLTHDEIAREAFVECPVPHPTWMFRRELVRELGGYREVNWPEDLDLLYRLLSAERWPAHARRRVRSIRIGKVPRVLHRWRDHDARLSRTDERYGREAFSRAKAHFLGRVHPMSAAIVWGAGRTGRRMVRGLEDEGVSTRALLDINPARIGSSWRGIPILSPTALDERAGAWHEEGLRVLGAVASRGARHEIRAKLRSVGLVEGDGFLMVA